jgi:hypothetical protein
MAFGGCAVIADMNVRPLEYPGSVVTPVGYEHTADMLRYKERLVMCDTDDLTGWPAMFRKNLARELGSRAWVKEVEQNPQPKGASVPQ